MALHHCKTCRRVINQNDVYCSYCGNRLKDSRTLVQLLVFGSLAIAGLIIIFLLNVSRQTSNTQASFIVSPSFTPSPTETIMSTFTPSPTVTITPQLPTITLTPRPFVFVEILPDMVSKLQKLKLADSDIESAYIQDDKIFLVANNCNNIIESDSQKHGVPARLNSFLYIGKCEYRMDKAKLSFFDTFAGLDGSSTIDHSFKSIPIVDRKIAVVTYSKPNDVPLSDIQVIHIYNQDGRKEFGRVTHSNTYMNGKLHVRDSIIGTKFSDDQEQIAYWTEIFSVDPDGPNYYQYSVHTKNFRTGLSAYKMF